MHRPYYTKQETLRLLHELVFDVDSGNPSVARKSQKHHAVWNAIRLLEEHKETPRSKSSRTPCCSESVRLPVYFGESRHTRTCRSCKKQYYVHVYRKHGGGVDIRFFVK